MTGGNNTAPDCGNHDANGNLQIYLREIGSTPLLAISEETALAHLIRGGDEFARDRMIRANLRLVVKIATDYREFGLPLADLISEGNIGLIKAVERFDPAKGGKFSTYAVWWIRYAMRRALANQGKTIRLPLHVIDQIARMRRTASALAQERGREPSDEDIAADLQVATATVALWRSVSVRPASLDATLVDGDDGSTLGEIVADEHASDAFECLRAKDFTRDLHDMIAALGPREATIIRLRFGLGLDVPQTLEQIAQKFGLTRERIRQLETHALRKLRCAVRQREKPRTSDEIEAARCPRAFLTGSNAHRSNGNRAGDTGPVNAVQPRLPIINAFDDRTKAAAARESIGKWAAA